MRLYVEGDLSIQRTETDANTGVSFRTPTQYRSCTWGFRTNVIFFATWATFLGGFIDLVSISAPSLHHSRNLCCNVAIVVRLLLDGPIAQQTKMKQKTNHIICAAAHSHARRPPAQQRHQIWMRDVGGNGENGDERWVARCHCRHAAGHCGFFPSSTPVALPTSAPIVVPTKKKTAIMEYAKRRNRPRKEDG